MNSTNDKLICTIVCFALGAAGGAFAIVALMLLADWLFIQALFIGLLIAGLGGIGLTLTLCTDLPAPNATSVENADATAPAKPAAAPAAAAAAAPAAAAAAEPVVQPSTALPGEAELAGRKGEWTYSADAGSGAAEAPATEAAATPSDDAGTAAEEKQPETLSAAREGGPDDLKLLKGVGPKLEQTLHELGFYHFDQIAAWTEAEVAWVDTRLKFKGRIERDGWIEQAKILAAGGETEFSKRQG
ncbi:MAG: endonuclease [Pseudomonadota bacterium]